MSRFLGRLWRVVHATAARLAPPDTALPATLGAVDRTLHRLTHRTIARVTDDVVNRLHFNTAIAAVMELVSGIADAAETADGAVLREAIDATLRLLAPFVPHVTSELWEVSGHGTALDGARWPIPDATALVQDTIELPVQVNGKVRGRVTVAADAPADDIVAAALADEQVRAHLAGRPVRKRVVVPGRMVSLVV
jgi:leucyl-tRNA synthetase